MPANYMLIHALKKLSRFSKNMLHIEEPGESSVSVAEMAAELSERLIRLFKKNMQGEYPYLGATFPFKKDPHWIDHLLFHEYYHGDTGQGLGASHQTGWTALVANLIHEKEHK